jgi:hypothetical protein
MVSGVARVQGSGNATQLTFEVIGDQTLTATGSLKTSFAANVVSLSNKTMSVTKDDYNRDLTLMYKLTQAAENPIPIEGSLDFVIDSIGPIPKNPSIDIYPSGSVDITLEFADIDVKPETVLTGNFTLIENVSLSGGAPGQRPIVLDTEPQLFRQNRFVKLSYPRLAPGSYSLELGAIKDQTGNDVTHADPAQSGPVKIPISIPAGNLRGQQPEYPRFLAEGDRPSDLNPGDRVDTRVVQLYYLRDARHVAELINRNIQDLNAVSWDAAQRAAADARKRAEDAIDNRRFQDERAVEAARRSRETETRLQEAQDELREVQRDQAAISQTQAELEAEAYRMTGKKGSEIDSEINSLITEVGANRTAINDLNTRIRENKNKLARQEKDGTPMADQLVTQKAISDLENERDKKHADTTNAINKASALRTLKGNIDATSAAQTSLQARNTALTDETRTDRLPSQLAQQQQTEITERLKVGQAEATELRASQEQFRREVAAGLADRDSYAPGRPDSIDPVAQVSIAVVGTSRLQLRGPIKGLNKICRMIHQLDSPVGQVKIGIHTIQVNGEHGDRMDVVYERINREVAHSRFLVNASGQFLRRAVQEVADEVAIEADAGILPPDCPPELQVGVVRLNGAIQTSQELRDRRYLYAFYGSDFIGELEELDSELLNTDNKLLSLHSMDTISLPGAMFALAHADHPVRHRVLMRFQELIAGDLPMREIEYLRSLTQLDSCGRPLKYNPNRANKIDEKEARAIMYNNGRTYTFPNTVGFFNNQIQSQGTLNPVQYSTVKLAQALKAQLVAEMEYRNLVAERTLLKDKLDKTEAKLRETAQSLQMQENALSREAANSVEKLAADTLELGDNEKDKNVSREVRRQLNKQSPALIAKILFSAIMKSQNKPDQEFGEEVAETVEQMLDLQEGSLAGVFIGGKAEYLELAERWASITEDRDSIDKAISSLSREKSTLREKLTGRQAVEQFMDEQEEKSVELMEALRAHSSNIDNYLKRLAIAVEDDVAAQFYEPAFQRIRTVSRTWDVTLGQIETTTILTNNRTLAKVSPAASFEFDLPERRILITEAMQGAKALADEYGNLLKDPTFVSGSELLRSRTAEGITGANNAYTTIPGTDNTPEFGSELDKLIQPPAIYKFETGTGFEVRPVIQPDGNSVMYTFDYEYTTNVREPVRADEKHLGRIKRHFVHTEVQTSSYELREVSRYTVSLKAARTDRGVPLLEDIPVFGQAFRPLPSEESSLQTNIILGSSTIYPTVYDLMGLRWSPFVDGEGVKVLSSEKTKTKERADALRQYLRRRVEADLQLDE